MKLGYFLLVSLSHAQNDTVLQSSDYTDGIAENATVENEQVEATENLPVESVWFIFTFVAKHSYLPLSPGVNSLMLKFLQGKPCTNSET